MRKSSTCSSRLRTYVVTSVTNVLADLPELDLLPEKIAITVSLCLWEKSPICFLLELSNLLHLHIKIVCLVIPCQSTD